MRTKTSTIPPTAVCAVPSCGKTFVPKRAVTTVGGHTIYCSMTCMGEAKRKYPKGQQRVNRREDTPVPCATCGTPFHPLSGDKRRGMALYCCRQCFYRRDGTLEERLMKYRDIVPATGCWLYTRSLTTKGGRYGDGYGVLTNDDGKRLLAHRVAASLWLGIPLDSPLKVLHSCPKPDGTPGGDDRRCFNPAHLGAGDQKLNMRQAAERGRLRKVLTEGLVIELRNRYARGETPTYMAREIGCSRKTVYNAVVAISWQHVPRPNSAADGQIPFLKSYPV